MNKELVNDILSLPFFEGKKVVHTENAFALHLGVDADSMMFLPTKPDDENQIPSYSMYCSLDGIIRMDRDSNSIRVVLPEDEDGKSVQKDFVLSTYNLEQHKQSGTVLSYDIVTVLHTINEIFAFHAGE